MLIKDGDDLLEVLQSKTLNETLQECINDYFPELKEEGIRIGYAISLKNFGGAKAGNWVILFLSSALIIDHPALGWIVIHELCHFISLHNPDEVFKKKVPKNVWDMWRKLKKEKELVCDAGCPI